jgi:hypothetical protein
LLHVDRIKNPIGLKIISLIFEPGDLQIFRENNKVWNSTLKLFSEFMVHHLKQAILLINENNIRIDKILGEHHNDNFKLLNKKSEQTLLTKRSSTIAFQNSEKSRINLIRSFQDPEVSHLSKLIPPSFKVFSDPEDLNFKYNNVLKLYFDGSIRKEHVDHYLFLMSKVNMFRNELNMHQNQMKSYSIAIKKNQMNHKTSSFLIPELQNKFSQVNNNIHFNSFDNIVRVENKDRF